MVLYYNPTALRNATAKQLLQEEANLYLYSPTNTFVVFNEDNNIEFEGTLPECYVYSKWYKRKVGYDPCVYSKEVYNNMINELK